MQHDAHAHQRYFQVGDPVYVRDFSSNHSTPVWIKGEVMECRGPLSYAVCLADGRTVQRHVGHIRTRPQSSHQAPAPTITDVYSDVPTTTNAVPSESTPASAPQLQRSQRIQRRLDWFILGGRRCSNWTLVI